MDYKILDKNNIIEYIHSIEEVKNYFNADDLYIDEIGDGNLNYVFIIKSIPNPKKALILKQAVPYLRCVGEEYPLSRERMTFEIRALEQFSKITSNYIPKLYDVNEDMSCVIMQYLGEHIIMRQGMINKTLYPNFAEHISTFLAQNLFKTSSLYLNSTEKRELIDKFNSNTELCKLTEDFVFTFAFMEHETNDEYSINHNLAKELFEDSNFKKAVLGLKYKFMTQSDALLHGDLHTGSIMLNQEETFIIDPEFAFVGPFGFDIGALIGNLIMSYTSHVALNTQEEYRIWILKAIEEIFIKFEEKFLHLWNEQEESALIVNGFIHNYDLLEYKKEFMLNIFQDALGYAACKMARRMFGIAGVADIRDIKDEKIRDYAIKMTLDIAKVLVKDHKNITKVETVLHIIKEKTK
ncbi:S-methyl-5-thioribose kinase [Arcobacter sp. LA11]|uniref:S-methyl-5-thioribose kinase n=1 Tax=Arcobacter sp. LA11 TaxID=1898176 RepID=UPI000933A556|nr:S-methyl-5-thioribose kinase [Arcobacter sp. LA11]